VGGREGTWHIQNAPSPRLWAHHSRLKAWIHPFKGVATRYLPNDLALNSLYEWSRTESGSPLHPGAP